MSPDDSWIDEVAGNLDKQPGRKGPYMPKVESTRTSRGGSWFFGWFW